MNGVLSGVVQQYNHTSLEGHLGYEKCLQGSVIEFSNFKKL